MSKGTWQAVVIQQKTKRSDYKPIIAQSGMKDVPIGLLFGLWFNNYGHYKIFCVNGKYGIQV